MSQIQQLKMQLHQIAIDANQGAASLGGFKQRFASSSTQVLALIQGSATKTDADISELLDAAGRAVEQASEPVSCMTIGLPGRTFASGPGRNWEDFCSWVIADREADMAG